MADAKQERPRLEDWVRDEETGVLRGRMSDGNGLEVVTQRNAKVSGKTATFPDGSELLLGEPRKVAEAETPAARREAAKAS